MHEMDVTLPNDFYTDMPDNIVALSDHDDTIFAEKITDEEGYSELYLYHTDGEKVLNHLVLRGIEIENLLQFIKKE